MIVLPFTACSDKKGNENIDSEQASEVEKLKKSAEDTKNEVEVLKRKNQELTDKNVSLVNEYEALKNSSAQIKDLSQVIMSSDDETALLIELDESLKGFNDIIEGSCTNVNAGLDQEKNNIISIIGKLETELIRIFTDYINKHTTSENKIYDSFKKRGEKLFELRRSIELSSLLKIKLCELVSKSGLNPALVEAANRAQLKIIQDQANILKKDFQDVEQLLAFLKDYLKDLEAYMASLQNGMSNGETIVFPSGVPGISSSGTLVNMTGFTAIDLTQLTKLIAQLKQLITNIENDKKKGSVKTLDTYLKSVEELPDIKNLISTTVDQSIRTELSKPVKEIELTEDEAELGKANGGESVFLGNIDGSSSIANSENEIESIISEYGLDALAVADAKIIARDTNGNVYLSSDPMKLGDAVGSGLLAKIKADMNSLRQTDLDLVFVLDYSGSMSSSIKGTIEGMGKIVNSLQAISTSDRKVRVGIVTFESTEDIVVELNFTSNYVEVSKKLNELQQQFDSRSSGGDNPERSYHGLLKACTDLKWNSLPNVAKKMILITDAPSSEIQQAPFHHVRQNFLKQLSNSMNGLNVYPIIVPG